MPSRSRANVFDDTRPKTIAGATAKRAAKFALDTDTQPDEVFSAAAGGVAGAVLANAAAIATGGGSVALTTAGVAVGAAAGAIAGKMYGGDNNDHTDGSSVGLVADEIGAFYGMLEVKMQTQAPLRAAYSAAMVWFSLILVEFVASGSRWLKDKLSSEKDHLFTRGYTLASFIHKKAGMSVSLRTMYQRSMERYEREKKQCLVGAVECGSRTIIRGGAIDLGMGVVEPDGKYQTKWACQSVKGDKGVTTCEPPQGWYDQLQMDYGILLENKVRNPDLWSNIVSPKTDPTSGGKLWVVSSSFITLFGSIGSALLFVSVLSILFGTMSYYTAVWNLAKIKGRCKGTNGSAECQRDLIELGMAVDDTNSPNAQSMNGLWDPVSKGTMGWLVADILLSTLFL